MASAVLANRTPDPSWSSPSQPPPRRGGGGPSSRLMGKLPFSNPKFSKKRQLSLQPLPVLDIDESPKGGLTQSTASDDASSINRRPNDFNSGGYVTFNVSNYSKKEVFDLKSRLVSELDRIRQLKTRIESIDCHVSKPGPPLPTKKRPKNSMMNPGERAGLMKKCGQILTKLMKHKHGYIFNAPVDVVGLKLHDYYDVIKCPMDLGTVKGKLRRNGYNSPVEFAADVRLTFNNAMRYNPKGHDVFVLAEGLLGRFEELYRPIREKVGDGDGGLVVEEDMVDRVRDVEASSRDRVCGDVDLGRLDREDPVRVAAKPDPIGLDRDRVFESNPNPSVVSSGGAGVAQIPVKTPSPVRGPPVKPLKQPKPKAKDPNKREMSMVEKHKLGLELQNLPPEKMEQVVTIIRRRNGHLRQDGDEIELDIEAVDTETLWELDRFVTNYKKLVSKMRRQVLMGANNNVGVAAVTPSEVNEDVPALNEMMEVVAEVKKPKKGDVGDEDVDIGDEMPMSSFPPVEIEKDNGHVSSSSSSSSGSSDDSSSSSDSDSGSSSGSDSEDAHL